MLSELFVHTQVVSIVGDILTVRATGVGLGELAVVENDSGETSLAQATEIRQDEVSLQVFSGGRGLSSRSRVRFLGHPAEVAFSPNILGRVFNGVGEPIDGGPELTGDPRLAIGGPSVNPVLRIVPKNLIETKVPMIDVFNCLVES
ncbi:MAG: V-type ATP synthase subunit B, partial [Planctomycetota bacterium]